MGYSTLTMSSTNKTLTILTSTIGLLAINFTSSLPANAAISCQAGTVNLYENNQLESCIITNRMQVQISNPSNGKSTFICDQGNYIFFAENGQFKSCVLSSPIKINSGRLAENCPSKAMVDVAVLDNQKLIRCRRLSY